MASKSNASVALFIAVNLFFFAMVSGLGNNSPTLNLNLNPNPNLNLNPNPTLNLNPNLNPNVNLNLNPNPNLNTNPNPNLNTNPNLNPNPNPNIKNTIPNPNMNTNPKANPTQNPNPTNAPCLRDTLKLGVCANLLGGLVSLEVGSPPVEPCCSLIQGLVDLEAAVCLCTAIKANILGINLDVPVSLSLLLNACGNNVPSGFECA